MILLLCFRERPSAAEAARQGRASPRRGFCLRRGPAGIDSGASVSGIVLRREASPIEGGDRKRNLPAVLRRAVLLAAFLAASALADDYRTFDDVTGDAVIRRTDPGNAGPVDPGLHRLPDLRSITLGSWNPNDPRRDLYTGNWDESSNNRFLRADIVFDGLINPPGFLPFEDGFSPFEFGPHPVFGWVELDVDDDTSTGGEFDYPDLRYLGNAVRFGGVPDEESSLRDRFARDPGDFDWDCRTGRDVEYSGEEFHIALFRTEFLWRTVVSGDGDGVFESGETWDLTGTWLHRAHAFDGFSLCGPEQYRPECDLRWSHSAQNNRTTVTLIFPLNNRAARDMRGDGNVEAFDCDPTNQTSIQEVLDDLVRSGSYWRSRPADCKKVIVGWGDLDSDDDLRPRQWAANTIFGSSYTAPVDGTGLVWTDIYPDARAGNVDGDSSVGRGDFDEIYAFVRTHDGGSNDADGTFNGQVGIQAFSEGFSVYDVDYDGAVTPADALFCILPGDLDGDGDVDLDDWAAFSLCYGGPQGGVAPGCSPADFDFDGDVDLSDAQHFQNSFAPQP